MLARHLRAAWPGNVQRDTNRLTSQQQERVSVALRAYEAERRKRVLPISLRSYAIGAAGQIANPLVGSRLLPVARRPGVCPAYCTAVCCWLACFHAADGSLRVVQVCRARDTVISRLLPVKSFLDHTLYDCGSLTGPVSA